MSSYHGRQHAWRHVARGARCLFVACQPHARLVVPERTPNAPAQPQHPRSSNELAVRLVYQAGPAPECSNWYAALRLAGRWMSCDPLTNTYTGVPKNPCQERVQSCRNGCDICPFLEPGAGPSAEFEDLGPLSRSGGEVEGIRGKRSLMSSSYIFSSRLCEEMSWIDVLAATMIHEALHQCHGGRGISDFRSDQSGCSANSLERFCTGIYSKGGS